MNDGGGSEWTARLTTALRSSRRVRRRLLERRRAERTTAPERVWRCRAGLMLEADCVHDHARPRPEWTWTTCGVDSAQATSVPMHADCPAARERETLRYETVLVRRAAIVCADAPLDWLGCSMPEHAQAR